MVVNHGRRHDPASLPYNSDLARRQTQMTAPPAVSAEVKSFLSFMSARHRGGTTLYRPSHVPVLTVRKISDCFSSLYFTSLTHRFTCSVLAISIRAGIRSKVMGPCDTHDGRRRSSSSKYIPEDSYHHSRRSIQSGRLDRERPGHERQSSHRSHHSSSSGRGLHHRKSEDVPYRTEKERQEYIKQLKRIDSRRPTYVQYDVNIIYIAMFANTF
jgi:hypothetical protein